MTDATPTALHGEYTRLTGLSVPLSMQRIFTWDGWKRHGWTADDLALVVKHLKAKIKAGRKWESALSFSRLIGDHEGFAEELAEARALSRRPKVDPARAEVLKATGRPAEPPASPAESVSAVLERAKMAKMLSEWREANL